MRLHPFRVLGLAALLCGCTTIYKSTAGDYADAARQVSQAVLDSESALAAAERLRKIDIASTDTSCTPKETLYLRPKALSMRDIPAKYFTVLAQSADPATSAACVSIVRCEATTCSSVCYSNEETECIATLAHHYTLAADLPDAPRRASTDADGLRHTLRRLSVTGGGGAGFLTASYLDILSSYIDVLGKAADGQAHAFVDDVKELNSKIDQVAKTAKSVLGRDIVSSAALGEGESRLTAFGQFFQDLKIMESIAADNRAIREEVNKNGDRAKRATEALRVIVVGNIGALGEMSVSNTLKRRRELVADFKRADSDAARRQTLQAWSSLPGDDEPRLAASADKLFAKVVRSQDTLVQLINQPTDDQLRQIRAEQFASFKNAATDLAHLVMALK